jgi:hypothetical protein
MSKRSSIGLAVLLLAGSACAAQAGADLPAGPMQAKANTACAECHDARIILQQRLNNSAWTKEVDQMTKWGALVDPQDRDALIDYLSSNFPVDKPEYAATRIPKSEKRAQKK